MSIPTPPAFQGVVPPSDIPATQQASSLAPAAHSAVAPEADTPTMERTPSSAPVPRPAGSLYPPATLKGIDYQGMPDEPKWDDSMGEPDAVLELADGLALAGHSFGAKKSVAGECVFQTGTYTVPAKMTMQNLLTPSRYGRLSRVSHRSFILFSDPYPHLPPGR